MAGKKVYIDIVVDDKGTTKRVAVDAKRLGVALEDTANATERTHKANEKYSQSTGRANKQTRGLAGTASSTGKTLGNLASGIQGGLVPAYATLAAHVFAITALFEAFSRAADTTKLIAGQQALAANTGVAYRTVSNAIKEATGAQLSFKDAASAAAIGTAAGLSPAQLERLGKAAKDTSFLLGRDLTDSFNRLVRGVTKAEPELLDELGIILRLEPATKKYADSIGKAVGELSAYERSQAVANEVLSQAERKFGDAAEGADDAGESVARLKSSFDGLMEVAQTTIIKGLAPAFDFLAANTSALTVASGVLGLGFIKAFTPAGPKLTEIGTAADGARARIKGLMLAGGKSKLGAAIAGGAHIGIKEIAQLEKSAAGASSTVLDLSRTNKAVLQADLDTLKLDHDVQMSQMSKGWKKYHLAAKAGMSATIAESGKFLGSLRIVGRAASRILTAIPFLGIAYLAFEAFMAFRESSNSMTEAQKAAEKRTDTFAESMKTLGTEMDSTIKKIESGTNSLGQTAIAMGNMALSADLLTKLSDFEQLEKGTEKYTLALGGLIGAFEKMSQVDPRYDKFVDLLKGGKTLTKEQKGELSTLNSELVTSSQALQRWGDTYTTLLDSITAVASGGAGATPLDNLVQNTEKGLVQLGIMNEALLNSQRKSNEDLLQVDTELAAATKRREAAELALNQRRMKVASGAPYQPGTQAREDYITQLTRKQSKAFQEAQEKERELLERKKKLTQTATVDNEEALAKQREQTEELERYLSIWEPAQQKMLTNQKTIKQNELDIAEAQNLGLNLRERLNMLQAGELQDQNALLAVQNDLTHAVAAHQAILEKKKDPNDASVKAALAEVEAQRKNVKIQEVLNALKEKERKITEFKLRDDHADLKVKERSLRLQHLINVETDKQKRIEKGLVEGVFGDRADFESRQSRLKSLQTSLNDAEQKAARAQEHFLNARVRAVYNSALDGDVTDARDARDKARKDVADAKRRLDIETQVLVIQKNMTLERKKELQHRIASTGLNPLQESYYLRTREHIALFGNLRDKDAKRIEEEVKLEHNLNSQLELKSTMYNTLEDQFSSFFSSFAEGTTSATEAFKSMSKGILVELAKMFARMLATKILMESFGLSSAPSLNKKSLDFDTIAPQSLTDGSYLEGKMSKRNRFDNIPTTTVTAKRSRRYGGIVDPPKYSMGGIARGRESGYPAVLHGTEAVVPLPNNREIPVDLKGGSGTNNVVVNVSMEGQSSSRDVQGDQQLRSLGTVISSVVQDEIQRQKRPGGLLSPYGAA